MHDFDDAAFMEDVQNPPQSLLVIPKSAEDTKKERLEANTEWAVATATVELSGPDANEPTSEAVAILAAELLRQLS